MPLCWCDSRKIKAIILFWTIFLFNFPWFCFILAFQMAHQGCFDNSQLFCLYVCVGARASWEMLAKHIKVIHISKAGQFTTQRICLFRCSCNSHSHSVSLCLYLFCLLLPPLLEVAGVSEAYEDAANCLWLLTNSKPCANCKSPIQKNEGCNHMQCAKVS